MPSDLAARVHDVRLLLETLNDPYPTPRSALVPDSGPAPSRYVPCLTCRRTGQVRARGGWIICLVCDGTGSKRREREPEWDAYLNMPLTEAAQLPLETPSRPPIDPGLAERTYAWERALRSHDRHGSYRQVRRHLDSLSRVSPRRYRLVRTVIVEHEPRELTPVLELELELGVVWIALRISRVRVPPWLVEKAGQRATLAALVEQGLTPGQMARVLGISRKAAQRKLRRMAVDSAQRRGPLAGTGGAQGAREPALAA